MTISYKWNLTDLKNVNKHGLKVFSCFACGGGSTLGYKLAGFDVIGANDIDPEMAWHYKENHNPKHYFLEDIRTFKMRDDLPKELYDLDILDLSPPCSSFSNAGSREDGWGTEKVFREGQAKQTLDDLFFDSIDLAKKLQPKVVIAENVKGMIQGAAKGYVKLVIKGFNDAGYEVQLFLLNAASMGVPQVRERVFFICQRKDLKFPQLKLAFNQKPITVKEAFDSIADINYEGKCRKKSGPVNKYWKLTQPGKSFSSVHETGSLFNWCKLPINKPSMCIPAHSNMILHYESPRDMSQPELCVLGSYPLDYKFKDEKAVGYLVGMSVPPIMMYGVANEVYEQWFKQ